MGKITDSDDMGIYYGDGSVPSGQVLMVDGSGNIEWSSPKIEFNNDLKKILDIVFEKCGIEEDPNDLLHNEELQKKVLRQLKIDDIINDN
jgi:hypothetical protein